MKWNNCSRLSSGIVVIAMPIIFLCGCASTSTFNAYTSQINPLIQDIKDNKPVDLKKSLANKVNSSDKIVYLMERGRIAQIQGDIETSRQNYELSMQAIRESDDKAVISASGAGAQGAAIVVNDNAIPYQGDGFERVMLHHFQALNFLAKGDIEGAGVEVRRANAEQEDALKRHEKELLQAQEAAKKENVSPDMPPNVAAAYAAMDAASGNVKSSFQNAYTFFLSGVVYEMLNQPNDAYIDYKKAAEIFSGNSYLQKDLVRLARQLRMGQDIDTYKTLYPSAFAEKARAKNEGELVVLFDDDFIIQKKEIKIPVPVSLQTINFIALAFPIYDTKPFDPKPLLLHEGQNLLGATEPICNVDVLAVKALKEEAPAMAIRQLIRAAAKAAMAKVAEDQGGMLGSLLATAYNVASENADLRSWVTLPAAAGIMRMSLPEGEHEFTLAHKESGLVSTSKVNIQQNKITILYVVRAGSRLYCRVMP